MDDPEEGTDVNLENELPNSDNYIHIYMVWEVANEYSQLPV